DLASGPPADADLKVGIEGNADRWLAPFLGEQPLESRGRVSSVAADLRAEAPRLDALRGEVTVTGLDATLADVPLSQEGAARLALEGGRATLEDARWTGPDTEVSLRGTLALPRDLDLMQADGDLALEGKADLRALQALGRGLETGGFGTFALTAAGPLGAP